MRLSDIRTALSELDLRPTKSLGQNFLYDQNLARAIAADAIPEHVPFAIEVGPGLGSLTIPLLDRCDRLLLIEKDARLVSWLSSHLPLDRVEIIHADAITFDWRPLMHHGSFPLIGNLPYYATSPILKNFLTPCSPVSRATFAVQDEFAARLAATPGSPDYSALTVRTQRLWNVKRERPLPPGVFHPAPNVNSATLSLTRHPSRHFPSVRAAFFDDVVQRGFGQRRKQLRSLLKVDPSIWTPWCAKHDLPTTLRAENLSVPLWIDLARTLDPSADTSPQNDDELFDVVDTSNRPIGTAPRHIVHDQHLLHRAAHILVFNHRNELLLQKRSAWKDRAPSKWDSSAAGHLDAGETYADAAARETFEELGIRPLLEFLGEIPAWTDTGNEFVEIFKTRHDGPFTLPPSEIEDALFFPLSDIQHWIVSRPSDFAPAFHKVWEVFTSSTAILPPALPNPVN